MKKKSRNFHQIYRKSQDRNKIYKEQNRKISEKTPEIKTSMD